jgi:hypothetical protein
VPTAPASNLCWYWSDPAMVTHGTIAAKPGTSGQPFGQPITAALPVPCGSEPRSEDSA